MLRSTVSRIRLLIAVLGCAVLAASLFDWAQNLYATENGVAWVGLNSSSAPAIETAEIWRVSASCVRPYFVKALLRSKAALKDYYDSVPTDVRAWQSRSVRSAILQAPDQNGLYRPIHDEQDGPRQNVATQEHGAMLHAQYAEWYANVFTLEMQESQWEHRLSNVADQSVTLGEATRRSFAPSSGRGIDRASAKGDFDHYVLVLLGLGGFPSDQEQALRANCVDIVPVKKIRESANYFGELWRWPVAHAAAFSFGLELLFIGMLFVPIALWIGTGDSQAIKRHIRDAADRFVTRVRSLPRSKFVLEFLRIVRAILVATRAIMTARTHPGPRVGEIRLVSKLAQIRLASYAPQIRSLAGYEKVLHRCIGWSKERLEEWVKEWPKRSEDDCCDDRQAPLRRSF